MADRIESALSLVYIHSAGPRYRQRDVTSLRSGGMRLHVAVSSLSNDCAQGAKYRDIRDLYEISPDAREA
jgi:hypothetical protein